MNISNSAWSNGSQIAEDSATQTAIKPTMRRLLIIGLASVVSILVCAIAVVASSRGLSRAETDLAQAKSEADKARKTAAVRIDALESENVVLKKRLELAKADFDKQAERVGAAEKDALRLRGDLDAAMKQVADLTQKYADARDAEHRAMVDADAAKAASKTVKPPVAEVEVVHEAANRNGNVNRNGKRRGSVALLPRTSPSFSELDKNVDGRLSLAEFKAGFPDLENAEAKFKELDENNDGYLSLDEYKAGFPDPATVHVQRKKKKS